MKAAPDQKNAEGLAVWMQGLLRAFTGRESSGSLREPTTPGTRRSADEPQPPEADGPKTTLPVRDMEASNLWALNEMLGGTPGGDAAPDLSEHSAAVAVALSHLDAIPKQSREATEDRMVELGQVPSLASIVNELRGTGLDDALDVSVLVKRVSRDPGLTVKILRMTNSPFYAPSYKVRDLGEAVQILGSRRVSYLVQTARTLSDFDRVGGSINWRFLWIHSFAVGLLGSEIARLFRIEPPGQAYLAGLLHDLGKVLLALAYPEHYGAVLSAAYSQGLRLSEAETLLFGMNHLEAGCTFAAVNGLSDEVCAVMRWHDDPLRAGEQQLSAALVNLSNALCKLYGLGFSGSTLAHVPDTLETIPGWGVLADCSPNPPRGEAFRRGFEAMVAGIRGDLFSVISGLEQADRSPRPID